MASGNVRDIDVLLNEGYQEEGEQIVTSVNGMTGDVQITKKTLSIENVDNTSDLDKPVSTATQAALNAKANASDLSTLAKRIEEMQSNVSVHTHIVEMESGSEVAVSDRTSDKRYYKITGSTSVSNGTSTVSNMMLI